MTHFQLYNVSSMGWEEGPICQHSRGLRLVTVVVGEPSQSCWIEELGSYPEVLAVSAFGGGGSSELSMLNLQCLSDICHNYQVSELSHPRLTRHGPLVLLFILISAPQASHSSATVPFRKHPHCHTPVSLSLVPWAQFWCAGHPPTPLTLQHAGSVSHCFSLFSKW